MNKSRSYLVSAAVAIALLAHCLCLCDAYDFDNCGEPCDFENTATWGEDANSPTILKYHDCSGEIGWALAGDAYVTATTCGDHGEAVVHRIVGYSLCCGIQHFQCKPQTPDCPLIGASTTAGLTWGIEVDETTNGKADMKATLNVVGVFSSTPDLHRDGSDSYGNSLYGLSQIDSPYDGATVKIWCEARAEAIHNPTEESSTVVVAARAYAEDAQVDWEPWE